MHHGYIAEVQTAKADTGGDIAELLACNVQPWRTRGDGNDYLAQRYASTLYFQSMKVCG